MDLILHVIVHDQCVHVHTLNGPKVSEAFPCWPLTHGAYLEFKRSKWYIIDKQSSSGVYHNGRKIKVLTSIALRNGSSLCLGPPADVFMKYECYFVSSLKSCQTLRNTRQRPKPGDAVCSAPNCSFKKSCIESESSEESQTDTVSNPRQTSSTIPHATTSRTSKITLGKNRHDKSGEKGKDALSVRKQTGRKRKASVASEQDEKKLIPIKKKRLSKLEKCKRCSKLEAQSSQMKRKIAKLVEYKLKMPVINQKVLEAKLKKNSSNLLENLLEDNFTCAICTEVFIKAVSLSCSHTFCEVCLSKCKEQSKLCPMCRTPITLQHRVDIIDKFVDSVIEKMEPEIKKKRDKVIAEREAKKSVEGTEQSQQGQDQPQPSTSSSSPSPTERIDNLLLFIHILSRFTDSVNRGEHSDNENSNNDTSSSNVDSESDTNNTFSDESN